MTVNKSDACLPNSSQEQYRAQNISEFVIINLGKVLNRDQSYCFITTASNGTYTAMIKGTFSTGMYSV